MNNKLVFIRKCLFYGIIILISLSSLLNFLYWPTSWLALLIGIIFAILLGNPYEGKTGNITSNILKASVVCIGFGYPISAISELSSISFYFVLIFILITIIIGYLLGRIMSVDKKVSDMISTGTAICGASAIAAIASTIKANEKQISISLGTLFILSASGLVLFPIIGNYLNLTQEQFGIWAGLAIHDTASAIGAAFDFDLYYNDPISEKVTTIIKLAKVIFIIPLVFFGAYLYKEKNRKFSFPYFIIFFILAMFLNSNYPEYDGFENIKEAGKKGLQISLFLIGTNLSLVNIKSIGVKPFIHGSVIWIMVSIISLIGVVYFL